MLLLGLAALAAEPAIYEEVVPLEVATNPEAYDLALEDAAGRMPLGIQRVRLVVETEDGRVPAEELLPEAPPVPVKESRGRSAFPVDHPGAADGFLSGKAVYLSQCHGMIWFETLDRYSTQRGNVFDTVEDFHNPEGMNQFLTRYLENAGAKVFTVKERDLNDVWGIADNDGEGYSETGSGFQDGAAGWRTLATLPHGTNPFDAGTTRRFPADGGAVATWVPEVPRDGTFAVYVSWDSDSENARDAHYRITHPGGVIDRYFDQTVHGSTWQYVETLWLPQGVEGLTIELVGDSTESGRWLSADAVRVGGGMSVIERYGEKTGLSRWEDGGIYGAQFNGAPTSVYDPYADGDGSDPSSRSRWAAWEHPSGEDAVYLSWHSNATESGGARGTITYMYEGSSGTAVAGSESLAQYVQDEIVDVARTNWESDWYDRGIGRANFSEVNPSHNGEMPAALVELAFHDTLEDVEHLLHPKFRRDASRAMYRGIAQYFAEKDGKTAVFLPEPPQRVALQHGDNGLVLSWEPGPSGGVFGDAADSYVVYTSADGLSWDNGTAVDGTSLPLDTAPGEVVYARVAGVNDGGLSFASETVGALRSHDGEPAVLVVGAFDRLDRGLLRWENLFLGDIKRMDLTLVNTADMVAVHGRAIAPTGWPFDGISDEALGDVDLSRYRVVVWGTGEESTADESFDAEQQAALRAYVEGGGTLWASGSEMLWDLDEKGSSTDQAFAAEVLGATMESDDAGTDVVDGVGILAGIDLTFGATYPVEYPDVLATDRTVIATYGTGGTAAALGGGVATFGFPFDSIVDPGAREDVAAALLPALVPDYTPPEGDADTDTDADSDTDVDTDTDSDGIGERVPKEPGGCGCSGVGAPWWLGLIAVLGLRRRR